MKNRKSIAFYIGDYTRSGGTERVSIAVANGLSKNSNLLVHIVSINNKLDKSFFEIDSSIKIINLDIDNHKKQYLKLIYRLNKALKANKIDVVVAVEVMSLIFILPASLVSKITRSKYKIIVWEHFNFTVNLGNKLRDFCRRMAAQYANYIVVLTKRDEMLWSNGLRIKNNIISINNISPFPISNNEYNLRSKNIVAIGRLSHQKGFDRLIDIWDKFLKIYPEHGDWKLQIIGSGPDEVMLKQKIKAKGLFKNIDMINNTSNISIYYKDASFLAMTSRFEGLPMTLIESQSFGLPIIAYDCITGPSEVVTSKSGFLIRNNDEDSFVEKLNVLISNKKLRADMSEEAQTEVVRFAEHHVLKKWESLIDNMLN